MLVTAISKSAVPAAIPIRPTHVEQRPYAEPEAATRKLIELPASILPVHIERINPPFLFQLKASGPEFGAGIKYAIEKG
ncbi:hypothetical protein [Bradyrhizobium sp. B117]|uniref:hypothetical protein n=1 Tax=Bradyrhizobium sp. B117 TaxID=3140246 RepID=UPI00318300FF